MHQVMVFAIADVVVMHPFHSDVVDPNIYLHAGDVGDGRPAFVAQNAIA